MTGTLARHGRSEAFARAPAEAVWRIVSDVTRVGEWSHECVAGRWLDAGGTAVPGARFKGRNRSGPWRWSRSCVFVDVDPPRTLAWRTGGLMGRWDSTEWRIELEATRSGTRIVQSYHIVRGSRLMARLYWLVVKAHRDRREALDSDLDRLARLAEAETGAPRTVQSSQR